MVYRRKSVSKLAAAAAAAVWVHREDGAQVEDFVLLAEAVVSAVHQVVPDKAPAYAAAVAKESGATDGMCTAIAAGVAAAAVGWDFKVVREVSHAAFENYKASESNDPDEIAAAVATAVRSVSSRYPAVEAAAAAAYAAYISRNALAGGGGISAYRAMVGERFRSLSGSADYRAHEPGAATIDVDGTAEQQAAVVAGNAAGEVAKMIGGPDCLSYAAAAAAKAATFRGARSQFVFASAVKAATSTGDTAAIAGGPADLAARAERVAVAITAAKHANSERASSSVRDFYGEKFLEAMPSSHDLIFGKLQTIVGIVTFLAAFLLYSLTGKKAVEEVDRDEAVQTVLQVYALATFLAAIITAGIFMVVTGGSYALTGNDVIIPTALSTAGFGLLLVTVAHAVFLELGEGGDDHTALFWTTVVLCFFILLFSIGFGMYSALVGSKYRLYCSCKACPTARRVEGK